jgi:hypothetical protein
MVYLWSWLQTGASQFYVKLTASLLGGWYQVHRRLSPDVMWWPACPCELIAGSCYAGMRLLLSWQRNLTLFEGKLTAFLYKAQSRKANSRSCMINIWYKADAHWYKFDVGGYKADNILLNARLIEGQFKTGNVSMQAFSWRMKDWQQIDSTLTADQC